MKMFLTRLGFGSRMVVTGDITQIDLPRDQRSGPGRRRRDPRRGRRHRLRPLRRRGRRPPPARAADRRRLRRVLASATSQRVDADSTSPTSRRTCAPRPRRRSSAAGVGDGHLSVELVDAERIRELNRDHRGRDEPTDVLSFPIDGAGPAAGPRELGDVVICPEHTADLVEATVHGVLHLCGYDHETDDGEMLALQAARCMERAVTARARASSASPAARTSASRRSSTRSSARRWRSSPTARRRPAAPAAGSPPTSPRAGSSCSSTCPGVQRPRDVLTERMQRRVEHELDGRRRGAARGQRRAGDRPRRPVHRRAPARRPDPDVAGDLRGQQGRPAEPGGDDRGARGRRPSSRSSTRSSRSRPSAAPASAPLVDAPRRAGARGPAALPARGAHRPAERGAPRRADPRAGPAAHPRGAPARGRGRGRGDGRRATTA